MQNDVWVVWPSTCSDRVDVTARKWQARGYKVAVLIDPGKPIPEAPESVIEGDKVWKGYPHAMNALCACTGGLVVVCGGDDIDPDPLLDPLTIAHQFLERFPDTFGVMQPTGDRFGSIDSCAPSPWIGRKFIEESYGGHGPFWEEYFHYFCDEELREVANLFNAFQARDDLTQFHDHWQREKGGKRPPHLMQALDKWKAGKKLFKGRRDKNFPGHGKDTSCR